MIVRFANETDIPAVNRLRRAVNDLHVEGRPETFKLDFCPALEDYIHTILADPALDLAVAEEGDEICGFAVLHEFRKPENPYKLADEYLDIDEFGVAEAWRRRGVGTALIEFCKTVAKERGFPRLELNMWEFNQGALAFYEAAGFKTYRRYMEIKL